MVKRSEKVPACATARALDGASEQSKLWPAPCFATSMTWKYALGAVGLAIALLGCESGCDEEAIDRAVAFIDDNQACETDDDCAVVGDLCAEIPGGFCGQIAMSKKGAESSAWKAIESDVSDCAPSSCEVCAAALVPTCTDGACSRR